MPITLKRALEVAGTVIVDGYEVESTEYIGEPASVYLSLSDGEDTIVCLDVDQTSTLTAGYGNFVDVDGKTVNIGFFETVPITEDSV